MLIINADDLGRSVTATDNSLSCYREGRVSSATAMVFMVDSERAAESALAVGIQTGLHLNLDLPFDGPGTPNRLLEHQSRTAKYFHRWGVKWSQVIYNPLLRNDFDYLFRAQYEEYVRLFGKEPIQIDGHHHRHLCMNMLVDHVMPSGLGVRRSFTFEPGERGLINRTFRRLTDSWLIHHYYLTDAFYGIKPIEDDCRLARIVSRARNSVVEIMVHPALAEQYEYLMSAKFRDLIRDVPKGNYRTLVPTNGQ